jgi:hypothetical protein
MTTRAAQTDARAIVAQIARLQKQENVVQGKLLAHERTRGEPCPREGDGPASRAGVVAMVPADANGPCSTTNKCPGFAPGNFCQGESQDPHDGGCNHYCPSSTPFYRSDLGGCVDEAYSNAHPITDLHPATSSDSGHSCLFRKNGGSRYSEQLINEIRELAEERAALFETLLDVRGVLDSDVRELHADLADQVRIAKITEDQLGAVRRELARIESREHDSDRMALINTYYSKRAQAHIMVIRMVILTIVPLLAVAIVAKKGWIPANVAAGIATCIVAVGGFFVSRRVWDLSWRSNMNYDEYDWYFDPKAADPTVYEYDKEHLGFADGGDSLAADLGIQCAGAACCDKSMRFDAEQGKCVDDK